MKERYITRRQSGMESGNREPYQEKTPVNSVATAYQKSDEFTEVLLGRGIKISMNGKGSWRDNVFVEKL